MRIMTATPVRHIAVGFLGLEFIEVRVKALGRFLISWRDPPDTRPQSDPISIGDCQTLGNESVHGLILYPPQKIAAGIAHLDPTATGPAGFRPRGRGAHATAPPEC